MKLSRNEVLFVHRFFSSASVYAQERGRDNFNLPYRCTAGKQGGLNAKPFFSFFFNTTRACISNHPTHLIREGHRIEKGLRSGKRPHKHFTLIQFWWFLPSVLTSDKLRPTFGLDYCNLDDKVWQGLWMILWALSTAFPEGFMPILGVVSSNLKPLFWQNVTSPGYQESDCHLDCPQVPAGFLPDSATADDSGL